MRIYKVAYNLTTVKVARCLNNCSGHGDCSEDAVCHCRVSAWPRHALLCPASASVTFPVPGSLQGRMRNLFRTIGRAATVRSM